MAFKKTALHALCKTAVLSAFMFTPALYAQDATSQAAASEPTDQRPVKPYGKNPNIFHVWAYKTQQGVINTAEKVGGAAERGIGKVKPSVDQAWDNTKDAASSTVQKVDEGAKKAAQSVNGKIQDTKEVLGGHPSQSAPIEQRSLSESSTSPSSYQSVPAAPALNQTSPNSSGTTAYPVTDL